MSPALHRWHAANSVPSLVSVEQQQKQTRRPTCMPNVFCSPPPMLSKRAAKFKLCSLYTAGYTPACPPGTVQCPLQPTAGAPRIVPQIAPPGPSAARQLENTAAGLQLLRWRRRAARPRPPRCPSAKAKSQLRCDNMFWAKPAAHLHFDISPQAAGPARLP